MKLLRSVALTIFTTAFCGIAAAQGLDPAEAVPATPSPAPEAAPAAPPVDATAGLVTQASLDDIKALFNAAGVPYEVVKAGSGRPYIAGKPSGWVMFVTMIGCADDNALTGCTGIVMESGTFTVKAPDGFINKFNEMVTLSHAVTVASGEPYTRQAVALLSGVAPGFLRDSMRQFTAEMAFFSGELEKALGGPQPSAGGSFAAAGQGSAKQSAEPRSGTFADPGIAGHAEDGAFGK